MFWFVRIPGPRPVTLGVANGKFAPCRESPNCVNSQALDGKHSIAPIPYSGSVADATARIVEVLKTFERATIVTQSANYVHAEINTATLGFIDDIEFFVDDVANVIHVKSASRIGYSDFGVNRKRLELLRTKLSALPPAR